MQITYHQTHTFADSQGVVHTLATQFYQTGIYGILDNNSAQQMCFTPQKLVKLEKKLLKNEKEGEISKLSFGSAITVSDDNGLWKIVSREYAPVPEDMPPLKIFIRKGKTYACKRAIEGVLHYLAVHKVIKDTNDLRESQVEFSVSPPCAALAMYRIGGDLYRSAVPIFQSTIDKKPIEIPQ